MSLNKVSESTLRNIYEHELSKRAEILKKSSNTDVVALGNQCDILASRMKDETLAVEDVRGFAFQMAERVYQNGNAAKVLEEKKVTDFRNNPYLLLPSDQVIGNEKDIIPGTEKLTSGSLGGKPPATTPPTTGTTPQGSLTSPFAGRGGEWGDTLTNMLESVTDPKTIKEHPILSAAVLAGGVGLIAGLKDIWSGKGMMAKFGAMATVAAIAGCLYVVCGLFDKDKGHGHSHDHAHDKNRTEERDGRESGERVLAAHELPRLTQSERNANRNAVEALR